MSDSTDTNNSTLPDDNSSLNTGLPVKTHSTDPPVGLPDNTTSCDAALACFQLVWEKVSCLRYGLSQIFVLAPMMTEF